jgi:hypothetical protein
MPVMKYQILYDQTFFYRGFKSLLQSTFHDQVCLCFISQHKTMLPDYYRALPFIKSDCLRIVFPYTKPDASTSPFMIKLFYNDDCFSSNTSE